MNCFQEALFPNGSRWERGHVKPPTGKLAVCGEVFIPAVPAAVYQTFSHCRRLRKDTWMGIKRDDLWFSRRGIIMTFHWDCTWGVSQL